MATKKAVKKQPKRKVAIVERAVSERRERIATAAMQVLLAYSEETVFSLTSEQVAEVSLRNADALIAALDQQE